jgi:hypothetical protein
MKPFKICPRCNDRGSFLDRLFGRGKCHQCNLQSVSYICGDSGKCEWIFPIENGLDRMGCINRMIIELCPNSNTTRIYVVNPLQDTSVRTIQTLPKLLPITFDDYEKLEALLMLA